MFTFQPCKSYGRHFLGFIFNISLIMSHSPTNPTKLLAGSDFHSNHISHASLIGCYSTLTIDLREI